MENSNRRLLIITGFVLFFVIIVLVWYFFYAKPIIAPTLDRTVDPTPVKTVPKRFSFLSWGDDTISTSTTEVTGPKKDPLVQVWKKPSTGQTFITTQTLKEISATSTVGTTTIDIKKTVRATSSLLLFVDRETGYIYGYSLDTAKTFQISNTLIPGVHDAYFFDNGSRIIMRYLDQEKNKTVGIIAEIPSVGEGGDPLPLQKIKYLSSQVISVAVNQPRDEVSYVVATENGSAVYSVQPGKDPVLKASSPFTEWDLAYGGISLYVTTKPSAYVEGSTFSLPLFQSEMSEKTGLMTNPSGSGLLLHSMWGKKGLTTFFSNSGNVKVLPVTTLANKCLWGRGGILVCAIPGSLPRSTEGLPDDWFQGRVSFVDNLFIVDKSGGDAYPLYIFKESEGVFDIVGLSLSSTNDLVSFNNKQDWSL
jgi:hypothetical protein